MSRYADHPSPETLYLWNTHLTKTYLADIEHLEVLLRNSIHNALTGRYGERWFDDDRIPFNNAAKKNIRKAKNRAGKKDAPLGKIIAELSFDFWRFLLSSHYQASVWPQVKKALKRTPDSRQQFEDLGSVDNAIQMVARFIDPHAEAWIKDNSRVPDIRAQRP
ncbi:hypothetical protein FNY86_06575 [Corynebacterium guaraldiae]|uniref:hypothetical protein n=1 Tax=Corynebacterium guaraldiae TaxID=3051103 RepID=UPI0011778A25|nr:hypothetical protein [Corynebacterium guaraldiae]TRX33126.1 hypothetical protein FNY86_06575 [Corynebacterium guaraldiae]